MTPMPSPSDAPSAPARPRLLKVIACDIAFREICHCAARSPNLLDLEFLTQGLHDVPQQGVGQIQARLDAVPAGRYEAVLVGYALCGNIIRGLVARDVPLVIPRAHDCITFFLGSRARYDQVAQEKTGTYFYTSGWLECLRRRGEKTEPGDALYLPTPAGMIDSARESYQRWVIRYGEEKARYLLQELEGWQSHYHTGALIDFEFTRPLQLDRQVRRVCQQRQWNYEEIPGDLGLLQRWLDGDWSNPDFLVVPPGHQVLPSYDDDVIKAVSSNAPSIPAAPATAPCPSR